MPVTTPVAETDPVAGAELLQTPPDVGSLSEMVEPTQTDDGPVMGVMPGVTDMVPVTVHAPPRE